MKTKSKVGILKNSSAPEVPPELTPSARRAAAEGYLGGLAVMVGVIGGGLESNHLATGVGLTGSLLLLHGVHRFRQHEQQTERD